MLALVGTKDLEAAEVYANFGGNFSSSKLESYIWGLGVSKELLDKWTLCAEIHSGETLFDRAFADNHVTSMLGLTYALTEKITFDGGVRIPLTDAAKSIDTNTTEATEKVHYVFGLSIGF